MKFTPEGGYPIYEFTSSSLTAGSNKNIADQPSANRVEGTAYGQKNFGMISFTGKNPKDRALRLTLHAKDGKIVWERTIKASEMR